MVKLKTYKEFLKMTKEGVDAVMAPVRAMKARKQAELEIAKMDESMATKEAAIADACMQKELDFNLIIRLQDEYCLLERRKKQFVQIIKELFPD
jgi:hypothetical protein